MLDPQTALRLLPGYLRESDPYLVAGAATALARLEGVDGRLILEMLVEACGVGALECREAVALAIASVRLDEARERLHRLAAESDELTALACRRALETLAGEGLG